MAGTLKKDAIQSFSISENLQQYENGKAKVYLFNITINAKIVADQTKSTQQKHDDIIARQTAIMNQFKTYTNASTEYFEVQPKDATAPFKFIPRVKSISFKEDVWVDFCDYTIEMEADQIIIGSTTIPSGTLDPSDVDESWSTEYNQEDLRLTKVNHKISARSKSVGSKKGWEISKQIVSDKINNLIPSDIQTSSDGTFTNPCNKLINYSININNGEFSADISLTYHNDAFAASAADQDSYAYHEQTVTDKASNDNLRTSLSIDGTITGLNAMSSGDRYAAALSLWNTVKSYLNSKYSTLTITSFSETHDKVKGIINYNYDIENIARPLNGIKSESISISYFGPNGKANFFATEVSSLKTYVMQNTIYGGLGPIFQDINTNKAKTMSITIERVGTDQAPNTLQYQPANSFIESDSINFTAQNKKISRTTTFVWADGSNPALPTISSFALIETPIERPY